MKANNKANFNYEFFHFFDDKKTAQCDKYYDSIPDLVLTDLGQDDIIKEPFLSEITKHLKSCKFCEHHYNIVENLILDNSDIGEVEDEDFNNFKKSEFLFSESTISSNVKKLNYKICANFIERPLAAASGSLIYLGECKPVLKDAPEFYFELKLYFNPDIEKFQCSFFSKNKLEKYSVIYENNDGRKIVLFSDKSAGIIKSGKWREPITLNIEKDAFNYRNIEDINLGDTIYIVEGE